MDGFNDFKNILNVVNHSVKVATHLRPTSAASDTGVEAALRNHMQLTIRRHVNGFHELIIILNVVHHGVKVATHLCPASSAYNIAVEAALKNHMQ